MEAQDGAGERRSIPKRRQVWEIPVCSRRAPLSLAGAGGWECTSAPPQPGRKLVLQQSQGMVQAQITASGLTHTPCLRSASSPWPLLPGAVLPRSVIRAYFCSSLPASASAHGDLPASSYGTHHLQQASSELQIPSGLRKTTHLIRRSDSASQANAPALQQGESTEVTMSCPEGRRAFCLPEISSMALQEESVPPSLRCKGQALWAASPTWTEHLRNLKRA